MSGDFLGDRRRALEDSFFSQKDKELIKDLQEKMAIETQRAQLSQVCGISDPEVLDSMIALGLTSDVIVAISLVPLVAVAWASGSVEPNERQALLQASEDLGIALESPARRLLENWLDEPPSTTLLDTWREYVHALAAKMKPQARNALRTEVMGHAIEIAEAAGGFLGLGNKISVQEQQVLDDLAAAFEDAT